MLLRQISDPSLAQYAYLIGCQKTGEALVVDPERDIDRILDAAARDGLTITHVAETHIHADFLSGARHLADQTGATLYLSTEGEAAGWGGTWARQRENAVFGVRAAAASALLASKGFDVTYINDSFPHYREIGPVETGVPTAVTA